VTILDRAITDAAEAAEVAGTAIRSDPAEWMSRRLGEHPWSAQQAIARAVRDNRRTTVRSCFGAGKSFTASRVAAWWIDTHLPGTAFVVSSAPTFPQVRAILWREIGRAHRKGRLPGRVTQTEWWLARDLAHRARPDPEVGEELVAFGRKPAAYDSGVAFQGIHAPAGVLVIFDEAAGIPSELWDAAEGLLADRFSRILAIGNPDDPSSRFARTHQPNSGWHSIKISAFDTPALTKEPTGPGVTDGLVSELWVEERRRDWGENHPLWQSRVLAEFPDQADDTVIALSWATAAAARELDPPEGPPTLGVDVARYGRDRSVIAAAWGPVVSIERVMNGADVVEVTGQTKEAARRLDAQRIQVDGVGIGAGVVDLLRAQLPGVEVVDMQAGQRATDPERFVDRRAEWWWALRERAEAGDLDLPDDEVLLAELTGPKYSFDARGRIRVESKDHMRDRGLESPDLGDAVIMALAPPPKVWKPDGIRPGGDTRVAPLAAVSRRAR
jgi:hypothetical protein